jgi:DNA-binding transcriptional ArsR family regulator
MINNSFGKMFRVSGNETRFAILKVIVENKGMYYSEIVKALPISQSAISLHLKELRNTRLIR